MSVFAVVSQRYLIEKQEVICTILSPAFAVPLLKKLRDLEEEKDCAFAKQILDHMIDKSRISDHIRRPTHLDLNLAKDLVKPSALPNSNRKVIGDKHKCKGCDRAFYDLKGKVIACPTCNTPIKDLTIC